MEEMQLFLMDSTNIDTSVWVGVVYPKTKIWGSKSVHTNLLVEAGETDYVNPLVEKAIATKWINIDLFRVLTAIYAAWWEDFTGPKNAGGGIQSVQSRFTEERDALK